MKKLPRGEITRLKALQGAKVSVVVPVYNMSRAVCETVRHVIAQTHRPHEIIIVDDGSTDGTAAALSAEFSGSEMVVVLSQTNSGPASARNHGIRVATGDYVAFTDGDCLPEREWLAELLKGFDTGEVAGVGGTVRRADDNLVSEYVDSYGIFNPSVSDEGLVECLVTANACFRKDVLVGAGLFDERFTRPGGEDSELSVRVRSMGHVLRYAPRALVLHHHRRSVPAFLKTMHNYGRGSYILFKLWPECAWEFNPRVRLVKSAFALRNMMRRGVAYRAEFGLKRAVLFSLLEHYGHCAYIWGHLSEGRRQRGLLHADARKVGEPARANGSPVEVRAATTDNSRTVFE